jgi:hypothetical protein
MVDLVKLRKKKRNAGVPPAEQAASTPPTETPANPATPQPRDPVTPAAADGGAPAGGDAGAPQTSKLDKFKAQAGKRRDLARTTDQQDATASHLELLTFVVAGEQYAVDIER